MRRYLLSLLPLLLLLTGCDKARQLAGRVFTHSSATNNDIVMQVGDETLYADYLKAIIPDGLTGQDSADFARDYMRQWATTQLMYSKAIQNLDATEEIDEMAETYRRELIVNAYQQQLVAQKTSPIPEDSLIAFYEREKKQFPLEETLVKGVFIKVPTKAPKQAQLSKWLKTMSDDDLESISKYCGEHAVFQEMFMEHWMPYGKIADFLPDRVEPGDPRLAGGTLVEQSEDFSYYLRLTETLKAGEPRPYELARGDILYLMTERQKLAYIKEFQKEIYRQAVKKGDVRISGKTAEPQ